MEENRFAMPTPTKKVNVKLLLALIIGILFLSVLYYFWSQRATNEHTSVTQVPQSSEQSNILTTDTLSNSKTTTDMSATVEGVIGSVSDNKITINSNNDALTFTVSPGTTFTEQTKKLDPKTNTYSGIVKQNPVFEIAQVKPGNTIQVNFKRSTDGIGYKTVNITLVKK